MKDAAIEICQDSSMDKYLSRVFMILWKVERFILRFDRYSYCLLGDMKLKILLAAFGLLYLASATTQMPSCIDGAVETDAQKTFTYGADCLTKCYCASNGYGPM